MMARSVRLAPYSRLSHSIAAGMVLWLSNTLLALLVAYPVLSMIDATGMTSGPDRDAQLFRPGALLLLELVRLGLPWFGSALKTALAIAALSGVFELLPLASALDLLHDPDRTLGERATLALRCFPRFVGLGVITWLARAALLLAASLLDAALKAALAHADERLLTLAPLVVFGLALLACVWLGSVLDVARAAAVTRDSSARESLLDALGVLRERPWDVLAGSYVSVLAGVLGYLSAAWFMTRLDLSAGAGARIACAFAAHQFALVFAIAWRVRWLRRALALSEPGSGRD